MMYWYNGALIAPYKTGFNVCLSKDRMVYRDNQQTARWAATAYRTLAGTTYKQQLDNQ